MTSMPIQSFFPRRYLAQFFQLQQVHETKDVTRNKLGEFMPKSLVKLKVARRSGITFRLLFRRSYKKRKDRLSFS